MSEALSSETIIVIADVNAKPGHEVELGKAFETAVQMVRTKDGCILYRLHQDIAAAGHFVLYEIWRDESAVDAHQTSEQFKSFLELTRPITADASIVRMKAIAE